jgi:hypothetical protein
MNNEMIKKQTFLGRIVYGGMDLKIYKGLISFAIIILFVTGCATKAVNLGPKREAKSYLSKTIAVKDPVSLYITAITVMWKCIPGIKKRSGLMFP